MFRSRSNERMLLAHRPVATREGRLALDTHHVCPSSLPPRSPSDGLTASATAGAICDTPDMVYIKSWLKFQKEVGEVSWRPSPLVAAPGVVSPVT